MTKWIGPTYYTVYFMLFTVFNGLFYNILYLYNRYVNFIITIKLFFFYKIKSMH